MAFFSTDFLGGFGFVKNVRNLNQFSNNCKKITKKKIFHGRMRDCCLILNFDTRLFSGYLLLAMATLAQQFSSLVQLNVTKLSPKTLRQRLLTPIKELLIYIALFQEESGTGAWISAHCCKLGKQRQKKRTEAKFALY